MTVAPPSAPARPLKGWHVLAAMVGFFAVVIGVNATFMVLAIGTFSGVVSDEPYVQGLDYNDRLAERAVQAERGWTATLHAVREPDGGVRVRLEMRDADGDAIRGLDVTGVFGLPASAAEDRTFTFEPDGDAYVADVDDLRSGEWELTTQTRFYDGAPFEARNRLWLF